MTASAEENGRISSFVGSPTADSIEPGILDKCFVVAHLSSIRCRHLIETLLTPRPHGPGHIMKSVGVGRERAYAFRGSVRVVEITAARRVLIAPRISSPSQPAARCLLEFRVPDKPVAFAANARQPDR